MSVSVVEKAKTVLVVRPADGPVLVLKQDKSIVVVRPSVQRVVVGRPAGLPGPAGPTGPAGPPGENQELPVDPELIFLNALV